MHIVIESGLMYSVSVVVFFVLYFASNNAQYGVSDCVSLPGAGSYIPPVAVFMCSLSVLLQTVQIIVRYIFVTSSEPY